jgi:glucan phosphoethanolaminetransferase (alkaline phosphatase superfamily)
LRNTLSAVLAILIGALGVGALWSILSLLSGGWGAFIAVPVAIVIVLLLAAHQVKPGWSRAILAALLTAVAIAYQCALFAVGVVAGEMGYSLKEAFQTLDLEFATAIIRAHTGQTEFIAYGVAILVALFFGYRGNRAASYAPAKASQRSSRAMTK